MLCSRSHRNYFAQNDNFEQQQIRTEADIMPQFQKCTTLNLDGFIYPVNISQVELSHGFVWHPSLSVVPDIPGAVVALLDVVLTSVGVGSTATDIVLVCSRPPFSVFWYTLDSMDPYFVLHELVDVASTNSKGGFPQTTWE